MPGSTSWRYPPELKDRAVRMYDELAALVVRVVGDVAYAVLLLENTPLRREAPQDL